jgi:hypothetical protein
LGSCTWPGYSGTVFEPLDEYKGDFARTYFYMSTRYYTEDASWNNTDMTNKSQLKPWALQMMLHWSTIDPVSTKETNRNNAMYNIQHNRNPFIDHPEYVTAIWGSAVSIAEKAAAHQLSVYPNPTTDAGSIQLPDGSETENLDIRVISVSGSVFKPNTDLKGKTLSLDVRNLPDGVYVVLITGTSACYHAKLVLK